MRCVYGRFGAVGGGGTADLGGGRGWFLGAGVSMAISPSV